MKRLKVLDVFKKKKLSALLLLGSGLIRLQAQVALPSTGSNASGSGGSASYSVGQVFYNSNTGTPGSVTQGVQQAYDISIASTIDKAKCISLKCSAFPNPTMNLINLTVEGSSKSNIGSVEYQLYNFKGKLIEHKKIEGCQSTIDMGNLTPATYFLKVTENNKEIKTFKIIKK